MIYYYNLCFYYYIIVIIIIIIIINIWCKLSSSWGLQIIHKLIDEIILKDKNKRN